MPEKKKSKKTKASVLPEGATLIEWYEMMVRIRKFEERCVKSYQGGNIGGFCHTYIGQESVVVGTMKAMGEDDQCVSAYRIHGHALVAGMEMNELMAELYGKVTGCSQGKGGSMHFMDPAKRFWGGHGIVGGQTPLGIGIAFALKYQGRKGACLCYLGDGAVNQGAFYESLNLAGLWELPVIYVIENNRYSMGTSQSRSSSGAPLAKRAEGFAIEWDEVMGNDVKEVYEATKRVIDKAHETNKPHVLEIHTYRYRGHSMSDPDKSYRSKDEIKDYREKEDPISLFEGYLLDNKHITEDQVKAINDRAKAEAEQSVKFAEASPYPPKEAIQQHIFWETDNPSEGTSEGTMFFNDLKG